MTRVDFELNYVKQVLSVKERLGLFESAQTSSTLVAENNNSPANQVCILEHIEYALHEFAWLVDNPYSTFL